MGQPQSILLSLFSNIYSNRMPLFTAYDYKPTSTLLRDRLLEPTSCLPIDLVREDNIPANDTRVTRTCSLHQIWLIVSDSFINAYSLLHHRHSTDPLQQPQTPPKPPSHHGLIIVPSPPHPHSPRPPHLRSRDPSNKQSDTHRPSSASAPCAYAPSSIPY